MNVEFYQISLKVILKNQLGQILILKADPNGTFAGFYDLPGGRIDKKEFETSLLEIMDREIIEEVGDIQYRITPKPVATGRHLVLSEFTPTKEKDVPIFYLFYEAEYLSGEVNISSEHDGFKWIDLTSESLNQHFCSGILEGMQQYIE